MPNVIFIAFQISSRTKVDYYCFLSINKYLNYKMQSHTTIKYHVLLWLYAFPLFDLERSDLRSTFVRVIVNYLSSTDLRSPLWLSDDANDEQAVGERPGHVSQLPSRFIHIIHLGFHDPSKHYPQTSAGRGICRPHKLPRCLDPSLWGQSPDCYSRTLEHTHLYSHVHSHEENKYCQYLGGVHRGRTAPDDGMGGRHWTPRCRWVHGVHVDTVTQFMAIYSSTLLVRCLCDFMQIFCCCANIDFNQVM